MNLVALKLYGKNALAPAEWIKDLKAKEAAVNAILSSTDSEEKLKLNRKIIRLNRRIPPCVRYV